MEDSLTTGSRTTEPPTSSAGAHYALIASLCALIFAGVYASDLSGSTIPVVYFIPGHIALELSSVIVSFAVFVVGWFGYRNSGNVRDLLIGVTFAAVGAVDFVHTLSYKGMPDFLAQNSPGVAAAYWLVARLTAGVGLVTASCVSGNATRRASYPWVMLGGAGLLVFATVAVFTSLSQTIGTVLYPKIGQPPSALKVAVEYAIILIYIVAFALLTEKRGWGRGEARGLRSAIIFAIFAEVAFTLYLSPYAWMNALGHVYKTAADILILNALFVAAIARPYEQLSRTKDELQALYIDAQRHRKEMERSFARIGSALSSSLDLSEALDQIADLVGEMLHVDCAVVTAIPTRDLPEQTAAQRGTCHVEERPSELAVTVGRQVLSERRSMLVNNIQATGWVDCDFSLPTCLRSMICAPMIHGDEALGVIAVYSHSTSAFEEGDVKLLEGFAAHAAVAIRNAVSYEHESRIADVLQRTLIETPAISIERFEVAQVYQPAANEALVGGDFYDVFQTEDGRLVLVIGDVAGKGLRAAVHTALVKYSLRAYINEGHGPATAVALLNNAVHRSAGPDTFITMFVGLLDPHTGEMTYTNAGHEPPIYSCDGTFVTLPGTGPVLGVWPDATYGDGTTKLVPGCILLLYTDGISEARNQDSFLGMEGIGLKLRDCEEMGSEDIARCVHRAAIDFAGGELRDDAVILAVRALR